MKELFVSIMMAVGLWMLAGTAEAKEQSVMIDVSFYTQHFSSDGYDYNNDNDILGVEYKTGDWYWNVASLTNSFYEKSYTFGAGYNVVSYDGVDLDILFGAMTGYYDTPINAPCYFDLCYYVAPRLSYSVQLTEQLSIKPSAKIMLTAMTLAVGFEYRF